MLSSSLAACVWIPLYALRCEEERRPELANKPTAILSSDDARRVWQVSPRARHHGVRPGMTIGQAIGLCGSLAVFEPDPVYYDDKFARLLLTLSQVSPVIEPVELGRVFVGADGLTGLYGNPEQQLAVVADAVRQSAVVTREQGSAQRWLQSRTAASAAGGPRAASVPVEGLGSCQGQRASETLQPPLGGACREPAASGTHLPRNTAPARFGWGRGKFISWVAASRAKPGEGIVVAEGEEKDFLASQPVAVLPLDPDSHHRLWRLGVRTLGQLIALPEEAVVAQFGRPGRQAWRLAAGLISNPVAGCETPEPIVAGMDFPTPIADRAILAHAIERLIEQALRHPRRAGWRVYIARVRAGLEQGASWMTAATLKDPSAERVRIAAPLLVKLEQAPPTGAVEHVTVEFTAFAPGTTELQLFARDAQAAARAGRRRALRLAAGEIKTRLSRSLLSRVIEVHPWSRLPERRFALIDFDP